MNHFKLNLLSRSICILEVLLLTFQYQTCTCSYITILPHDISMEVNDFSYFNLSLSEAPADDLWINLKIDHANVVELNESGIMFTNKVSYSVVPVHGINPGKVVVTIDPVDLNGYSLSEAFVRINVKVYESVDRLTEAFGWLYFICWTSNFYPQIFLNYRRKSVIGLNMDFIVLNLLGTFSYTVYNWGIYFSPQVKDQYFELHQFGILPIRPQDVSLSILTFTFTAVCGLQAVYYNLKDIRISKICLGLFSTGVLFLIISVILAGVDVINWLTCLYYFSYLKLGITTIKYIPQVYSNFRNKSTSGWSVGFPMLDFTGGTFSLMQMFLMAFNYDDWGSISGNPSKLALGIVSMVFDATFIIQYIVYRNSGRTPKSVKDDEVTTKAV